MERRLERLSGGAVLSITARHERFERWQNDRRGTRITPKQDSHGEEAGAATKTIGCRHARTDQESSRDRSIASSSTIGTPVREEAPVRTRPVIDTRSRGIRPSTSTKRWFGIAM